MFDLERALSDWRRQMRAAGLKTPAPLEELESHLREDIRVLLSTGKPEAEAFELAVSRLGHPVPLRTEFNKLTHPRCRPVTIGFWLYVAAMMLMAIAIATKYRLSSETSKVHLFANPFLLYAHIVTFTAGYCAAFLAGCFGIFYVCYRYGHALWPARRRSLGRAVFLFSHLAAGLTIAGVVLGMLWSRQNHLGGGLRAMAAFWGSIWLVSLLVTQRIGRVSERAVMLMCILGNVVVGLAWFSPFILAHGITGYWPLGVFLVINLVFLAMGMAAVPEEVES